MLVRIDRRLVNLSHVVSAFWNHAGNLEVHYIALVLGLVPGLGFPAGQSPDRHRAPDPAGRL